MLNSLTGGMDNADGFADNFNMLLPLLLVGDDKKECLIAQTRMQQVTKLPLEFSRN